MRAQNVALCARAESSAVLGYLLCSKGLLLLPPSHACVSYMAAWRIVQRVFSRKYNQNGRRGALYYVYFHENITKTGCCTFYAQLWNGPRELLIRLDGFKAVGGANEKL